MPAIPILSPAKPEPVPRRVENERTDAQPDEPEEDRRVQRKVGEDGADHCVEGEREDDPEPDIEENPAAIHCCIIPHSQLMVT